MLRVDKDVDIGENKVRETWAERSRHRDRNERLAHSLRLTWALESILSEDIFLNMAATWRFALFLCMLLMVSVGSSLANEETGHDTPSSGDSGTNSSSDHDTGHDDGHDTGHDGGHGGEPITTLPIVSWKWHHVTTPYLVALWILVSWICKLSES